MSLIRSFFIGVVVLGLADLASAEDKISADKLVGTWKVTKSETGAPEDAVVEFTKDGKMKVTIKMGEQTLMIDGTYKLEKDKLTVILSIGGTPGKEDSATIKKLTDTDLVTIDDKGKKDEFSKVAKKK